ncbi:MAG: FAD-dependent oxidoreductase, partial [Gammaproteobacteria bacterium]
MPTPYSTDIVIFGGGIAGLWLLNRLQREGFSCILLEKQQLGCGQSLASQGIIHGGLKYALGGSLTAATQAIADMPARWRDCFRGTGEIDLSACPVISEHYYMWSDGGVRSKLKA